MSKPTIKDILDVADRWLVHVRNGKLTHVEAERRATKGIPHDTIVYMGIVAKIRADAEAAQP